MSKRFIGSINVDKFAKAVKDKHSSLFTTEKGFRGINIVIWENDTPDMHGNTHSIQLQSAKDVQEEKVYIGNAKPPKEKAASVTVVNPQDVTDDQIPFSSM